MDFKFDQLIVQSVKRLTRPKLKHDFPVMYDRQMMGSDSESDPYLEEVITSQDAL